MHTDLDVCLMLCQVHSDLIMLVPSQIPKAFSDVLHNDH